MYILYLWFAEAYNQTVMVVLVFTIDISHLVCFRVNKYRLLVHYQSLQQNNIPLIIQTWITIH